MRTVEPFSTCMAIIMIRYGRSLAAEFDRGMLGSAFHEVISPVTAVDIWQLIIVQAG